MGKKSLSWKKSLLFKNIVINLSIIFLIILIISGISYKISADQITNEIETQLSMKLEETKDKIENVRESAKSQLTILSKSGQAQVILKGGESAAFSDEMQSFAANYPEFLEDAYLIDSSGKVIFDSINSTFVGTDLSDRAYFTSSMEGNAAYSEIIKSSSTGNNVEVIALPVLENDKVVGVLAAAMNIEYITSILQEIKIGNSGYAFLIDENGSFIYHPKSELIGTKLKDLGVPELSEETDAMIQGNEGSVRYTYDGLKKLDLYIPVENWSLSINAVDSEYLQAVTSMLINIAIVSFIMLLIASAISAANSYFTVKKIRKVQNVMGVVTAGDLTAELKEPSLKKCWEVMKCNKPECPAYENSNLKCWEMPNTLCGDTEQKDVLLKMEKCKECGVYKFSEGDELGQMGRSLSLMISTIHSLVSNISNIAERLTGASQELSSASEETTVSAEGIADRMEEMSAGAQNQTKYADHVNTMVQEMNKQLTDSMEKIKGMAGETEKVNQRAVSGYQTIHGTITEMKEIQLHTEKIEQVMTLLIKQSEEIGKINGLITAIAEETNLLSLNASIEAARAGENGKGFGVVADEIGKLAAQSQESAKGISGLIDVIVRNIDEVYKLMEQETTLVQKGIQSVEASKDAFEEIGKKVKDVVLGMNQVVTFVETAKSSSDGVTQAIEKMSGVIDDSSADMEEITATTEEQSSISQEISGSAAELASMAEQLTEAVKQFKV